jgi:ubiquinone/menaquinone biosynthesis C-methylase UbiE
MLGLAKHLRVEASLDVGCGTGFVLFKIKEKLPRVSLRGHR